MLKHPGVWHIEKAFDMHENYTPDLTPNKQCVKCKQLKPATSEYFEATKYCINGIRSECKVCRRNRKRDIERIVSEKHKATKEEYLRLNPPSPLLFRCCTKCNETKPATIEYFDRNRRTSKGWAACCKVCKTTRLRAKHFARKLATPIQQKPYPESMKECTSCKKILPASAEHFYKAKSCNDGLRGDCKKCKDKKKSLWKQDNRARDIARARSYKKKNLDKFRVRGLLRKARKSSLLANFTNTDWQFALDYFGGNCAVCQRPMNGLFHEANADHWIAISNPDCPGTIPANMVPLCGGLDGCNQSKATRHAKEWVIEKFGDEKSKIILAKIQDFFSKVRKI